MHFVRRHEDLGWSFELLCLCELNMTLLLNERRVPRDLSFMLCQKRIEIRMSLSIKSHTLDLAVAGALVGIEKPVKVGTTCQNRHYLYRTLGGLFICLKARVAYR